jgi:hypothetical protein
VRCSYCCRQATDSDRLHSGSRIRWRRGAAGCEQERVYVGACVQNTLACKSPSSRWGLSAQLYAAVEPDHEQRQTHHAQAAGAAAYRSTRMNYYVRAHMSELACHLCTHLRARPRGSCRRSAGQPEQAMEANHSLQPGAAADGPPLPAAGSLGREMRCISNIDGHRRGQ